MFDIAPTELMLCAVIALVVIGPKDLPKAMRFVGKYVGKARGMAKHFRTGLDTMMREAELEEMEKQWRSHNEAIMRAYFTEGKDIADPVVLVACASSTGIDAKRLLRVITGSDDDIAAAVRADLEWAAARDITAVPTFVINDSFAVPGARDAPTFARLIKKMTAQ